MLTGLLYSFILYIKSSHKYETDNIENGCRDDKLENETVNMILDYMDQIHTSEINQITVSTDNDEFLKILNYISSDDKKIDEMDTSVMIIDENHQNLESTQTHTPQQNLVDHSEPQKPTQPYFQENQIPKPMQDENISQVGEFITYIDNIEDHDFIYSEFSDKANFHNKKDIGDEINQDIQSFYTSEEVFSDPESGISGIQRYQETPFPYQVFIGRHGLENGKRDNYDVEYNEYLNLQGLSEIPNYQNFLKESNTEMIPTNEHLNNDENIFLETRGFVQENTICLEESYSPATDIIELQPPLYYENDESQTIADLSEIPKIANSEVFDNRSMMNKESLLYFNQPEMITPYQGMQNSSHYEDNDALNGREMQDMEIELNTGSQVILKQKLYDGDVRDGYLFERSKSIDENADFVEQSGTNKYRNDLKNFSKKSKIGEARHEKFPLCDEDVNKLCSGDKKNESKVKEFDIFTLDTCCSTKFFDETDNFEHFCVNLDPIRKQNIIELEMKFKTAMTTIQNQNPLSSTEIFHICNDINVQMYKNEFHFCNLRYFYDKSSNFTTFENYIMLIDNIVLGKLDSIHLDSDVTLGMDGNKIAECKSKNNKTDDILYNNFSKIILLLKYKRKILKNYYLSNPIIFNPNSYFLTLKIDFFRSAFLKILKYSQNLFSIDEFVNNFSEIYNTKPFSYKKETENSKDICDVHADFQNKKDLFLQTFLKLRCEWRYIFEKFLKKAYKNHISDDLIYDAILIESYRNIQKLTFTLSYLFEKIIFPDLKSEDVAKILDQLMMDFKPTFSKNHKELKNINIWKGLQTADKIEYLLAAFKKDFRRQLGRPLLFHYMRKNISSIVHRILVADTVVVFYNAISEIDGLQFSTKIDISRNYTTFLLKEKTNGRFFGNNFFWSIDVNYINTAIKEGKIII